MMSGKRFKSVLDEETMSVMPYLVSDKGEEAFYKLEGCVDLLNRLSDENNRLKVENEQLKQQLLYDGGDVCSICKHEYLTPSGDYFIGKCEKGHEECSKEDIKYCEDFKLKELSDE